jgi:hypothetical protein
MPKFFYVNGYGATLDEEDGNYRRYLTAVRETIRTAAPDGYFVLILAGGYTNLDCISEAQTMAKWMRRFGFEDNLVLIEDTGSLEENLTAAAKITAGKPVTVFCEKSRRHHTAFLAKRHLGHHVSVVPVDFDEKSGRLRHRLVTTFVRFPLVFLAYHSEKFAKLNRWLRRLHVKSARAKNQT